MLVAAVREDMHVELQLVSGAARRRRARRGRARCSTCSPRRRSRGMPEAEVGHGEPAAPRVERLRVRRVGDTLLYLTGPPNEEDLGCSRACAARTRRSSRACSGRSRVDWRPTAGLLVVGAADGADFAAAWDGVRAW